jgi:hypothetical protein
MKALSLIKDGDGHNTAVIVPMTIWEALIRKHADLKALSPLEPRPKQNIAALAGGLSKATGDAMLAAIEKSRNEDWEF